MKNINLPNNRNHQNTVSAKRTYRRSRQPSSHRVQRILNTTKELYGLLPARAK